MMTLKERGKAMYAKGYRYCVEFPVNIEPLFFKSASHVGPFIRRYYPDLKNYRGYPIDENGNERNHEDSQKA